MRWDDILNVLIELLEQNPGVKDARIISAEGLPIAFFLKYVSLKGYKAYNLRFAGVDWPDMRIRKIGPLVFYSYPKDMLEKDLSSKVANIMDQQFSEGFFTHSFENLSSKVANIMDQQFSEGFFTHSFENLKSMNYYFEIHSDWARGNKEMLLLSTILDQQISPELEEKISIFCKEFSEHIYKIFKAFYINDVNNFDEEDQKSIIKNESLVSEWVINLYWALIEATRGKTVVMSAKTKNTILIIDNEPILKLEDFETITCSNVNEALKLIEGRYNDIAIIILNPMTPELNIEEFLQFIKSDERYKYISVISIEKGDDEDGDLPYSRFN